jgi:hypothetical protein
MLNGIVVKKLSRKILQMKFYTIYLFMCHMMSFEAAHILFVHYVRDRIRKKIGRK